MCRLAITYNAPNSLVAVLAQEQENGGTRPPVYWSKDKLALGFNRFPITSDSSNNEEFPVEGKRYVLCYNGEVYGYKKSLFTSSTFKSDVHFASTMLEKDGLDAFLKDIDWQGTFFIFDKKTSQAYIVVDQLNTAGYFYSHFNNTFISASEYSAVHEGLQKIKAPASATISIVKNGCYLLISKSGKITTKSYRPDYKKVFSGTTFSRSHFNQKVREVKKALYAAVVARIPQEGPVAVLCSGGIDSSIILAMTVAYLKKQHQLARLRVFTVGSVAPGAQSGSDLKNVLTLLKSLSVSPDKFLTTIEPAEIKKHKAAILRTAVFCEHPRLIPPNPILNTQVRNTVLMSTVLALVVKKSAHVKIVLTGDAADEVFAGYPSMRRGVKNGVALQQRIVDTLNDFPLNDAARVTLSSYYGAFFVGKEILKNKKAHPVEVRTPFTSHQVLRSVFSAHPDYLVGVYKSVEMSKFLLRLVGISYGVPKQITIRHKIPFNEGAVGLSNRDTDSIERDEAARSLPLTKAAPFLKHEKRVLSRLGMIAEGRQKAATELKNAPHLALAYYAYKAGLRELAKGDVFRKTKMDSIYTIGPKAVEYVPYKFITLG